MLTSGLFTPKERHHNSKRKNFRAKSEIGLTPIPLDNSDFFEFKTYLKKYRPTHPGIQFRLLNLRRTLNIGIENDQNKCFYVYLQNLLNT